MFTTAGFAKHKDVVIRMTHREPELQGFHCPRLTEVARVIVECLGCVEGELIRTAAGPQLGSGQRHNIGHVVVLRKPKRS
jgi:hypothetical protein